MRVFNTSLLKKRADLGVLITTPTNKERRLFALEHNVIRNKK